MEETYGTMNYNGAWSQNKETKKILKIKMALFFLETNRASNGLIVLHLCIKCTTSFNTTPSVYITVSSVRKTSWFTHTEVCWILKSVILLHKSQEKMIQ